MCREAGDIMQRCSWGFLSNPGLLILGVLITIPGRTALGESTGEPSTRMARTIELAPSGAWCWFQDPRAV